MNTRATAFLRRPVPYPFVFRTPAVGCALEPKFPPQKQIRIPSNFSRDEFKEPTVAVSGLRDVPSPFHPGRRAVFAPGWRGAYSWVTSPEPLRVASSPHGHHESVLRELP